MTTRETLTHPQTPLRSPLSIDLTALAAYCHWSVTVSEGDRQISLATGLSQSAF